MSTEPDRVSWSEGIKINIGDYESYSVNISMSTSIRPDENEVHAMGRAKQFVQKKMRIREKQIRVASRKYVDFDTMAKLKAKNE